MKGKLYRCPQHIFDGFKGADETKKMALRKEAADWVGTINDKIADGDTVVLPHPITGKPQSWVKDTAPQSSTRH